MSSIVVTTHPPAPPPSQITAIQARRALRLPENTALRASIMAWIEADATGERLEEWDYATEYPRDSPLIEAARIDLQLSHAQIDDLFRIAATL